MAQTFLYRDYVATLSRRFEANVSYIQYIYGYDAGREFEIAACKTLRAALPQRFGVCRGHVVNMKGDQAGDDIIIYDKFLFPTLRLLPEDDFSLKEWIPIEAVYAYIEAKHTLNLEQIADDDGKQSTIGRAMTQLSEVKKLCATRERVPLEMITRRFLMPKGTVGHDDPSLPAFSNPMFGMVLSRYVRHGNEDKLKQKAIQKLFIDYPYKNEFHPDLIVAGDSNLVRPSISGKTKKDPVQPKWFFEDGCDLQSLVTKEVSFGVGLAILLTALDYIQLGMLPWPAIVNDAIYPD